MHFALDSQMFGEIWIYICGEIVMFIWYEPNPLWRLHLCELCLYKKWPIQYGQLKKEDLDDAWTCLAILERERLNWSFVVQHHVGKMHINDLVKVINQLKLRKNGGEWSRNGLRRDDFMWIMKSCNQNRGERPVPSFWLKRRKCKCFFSSTDKNEEKWQSD